MKFLLNKKKLTSANEFTTNAESILAHVIKTHQPVFISQNGKADAVLIDINTYKSMLETINIFSIISSGEKDVIDGKIIKQNELFSVIEKKFKNNR